MSAFPKTMKAVVMQGVGGTGRLTYTDVPLPGLGEVLLKVSAAGVNNTDINTRLGWYSAAVTAGTGGASEGAGAARADGGWNAKTPFPLIQGTDCCGEVVALGQGSGSRRRAAA
jgi:NADPH:quinone reductase-like Zn-dependent oxidoreductase